MLGFLYSFSELLSQAYGVIALGSLLPVKRLLFPVLSGIPGIKVFWSS